MSNSASVIRLSFVVKAVAKEETAEEVAAFLSQAVDMANEEASTLAWFALRTDAVTFWIVDGFANESDRQKHFNGPIPAALIQNADRLLAAPPEILPADVFSVKLPR
jgi:quinol monooxygenase YgiN